MRAREDILALVPHQHGMCLLDSVVAWDDARIHCRTASHLRSDNPLRAHGRLRAIHLCEYGAQAMAVHGGLLAERSGRRARPGLLVSLRAVRIECAWLDELKGALDVSGDVLLAGSGSWQYALRIEHAGACVAQLRAAVMLMSDPAPE